MSVIFDYASAERIGDSRDSEKLGKEIATWIESTGSTAAGQFRFKTTQGVTKYVEWAAHKQTGAPGDVYTVRITQYI